MTKIQEWEKMIERVESHMASKEEIIRFLKNNKPKPKESKKKLPCVCGSKKVSIWWDTNQHKFFCKCDVCDKEAPGNKFEIRAIHNWNEMVKKEIENDGSEN